MASAFAASAKWSCLTPPTTTLPVKPAAAFAAPVLMPLALTLSSLMITGAPSPAAIFFLAHVTDPVPLLVSAAPSMSSQPPAMLIIASFQPLLLPMLQIVPALMMVFRDGCCISVFYWIIFWTFCLGSSSAVRSLGCHCSEAWQSRLCWC
jgi:hypothetical protein